MSEAGPLDDMVLDFDPDALRERYRAERVKRVRADGNSQYVEVEGRFAHFVDDHFVEPGFTRAAREGRSGRPRGSLSARRHRSFSARLRKSSGTDREAPGEAEA